MIWIASSCLPAVPGAPVEVTARCSGVDPERVQAWLTRAPCSKSARTAAGLLNRTAWCSGVTPFLSVWFTSPPDFKSAFT